MFAVWISYQYLVVLPNLLMKNLNLLFDDDGSVVSSKYFASTLKITYREWLWYDR